MQIIHRVALTADGRDRHRLAQIGITVLETALPDFVYFDISETDMAWPQVREWIAVRRPSDIVSTTFTSQEVRLAKWLALNAALVGYPQPNEGSSGYLQATYDITEYCERCGVGRRQKAPFQMKGEPRWGRKDVMQLNWVFDELFVRPEVWTAVFEPHAVGRRPVTNRARGELQTVVQLVVEEHVSIETSGLAGATCGKCGRIKYLPVARGPMPPLVTEPHGHAVQTIEYFGSGASAFHETIVSQGLARAIESGKARGVALTPVAPMGLIGRDTLP